MMEDVKLHLIMVAEIQIKYLFLKRAQLFLPLSLGMSSFRKQLKLEMYLEDISSHKNICIPWTLNIFLHSKQLKGFSMIKEKFPKVINQSLILFSFFVGAKTNLRSWLFLIGSLSSLAMLC